MTGNEDDVVPKINRTSFLDPQHGSVIEEGNADNSDMSMFCNADPFGYDTVKNEGGKEPDLYNWEYNQSRGGSTVNRFRFSGVPGGSTVRTEGGSTGRPKGSDADHENNNNQSNGASTSVGCTTNHVSPVSTNNFIAKLFVAGPGLVGS